jgi:hypothetical protein
MPLKCDLGFSRSQMITRIDLTESAETPIHPESLLKGSLFGRILSHRIDYQSATTHNALKSRLTPRPKIKKGGPSLARLFFFSASVIPTGAARFSRHLRHAKLSGCAAERSLFVLALWVVALAPRRFQLQNLHLAYYASTNHRFSPFDSFRIILSAKYKLLAWRFRAELPFPIY